MFKYRAIHRPFEPFWNIEIFDSENQVAYDLYDNGEILRFLDKNDAEKYIKNVISTEEEHGGWFDGPV